MEGRDPQQKVAATRTEIGTDVNYGEITRQLIAPYRRNQLRCNSAAKSARLKRNDDNSWTVTVAV